MKDSSGNLQQIMPESHATITEYQGATTDAPGVPGLVPPALASQKDKFLRGDGQWAEIDLSNMVTTDTNQTITGTKTFDKNYFSNTVALTGTQIDVSLAPFFTKTISADTTFTITGVPTGKTCIFTLMLTNGGAYTVTFPNNIIWAGGEEPELKDSGVDILTFFTTDGGTNWYDCSIPSNLASSESSISDFTALSYDLINTDTVTIPNTDSKVFYILLSNDAADGTPTQIVFPSVPINKVKQFTLIADIPEYNSSEYEVVPAYHAYEYQIEFPYETVLAASGYSSGSNQTENMFVFHITGINTNGRTVWTVR